MATINKKIEAHLQVVKAQSITNKIPNVKNKLKANLGYY